MADTVARPGRKREELERVRRAPAARRVELLRVGRLKRPAVARRHKPARVKHQRVRPVLAVQLQQLKTHADVWKSMF